MRIVREPREFFLISPLLVCHTAMLLTSSFWQDRPTLVTGAIGVEIEH